MCAQPLFVAAGPAVVRGAVSTPVAANQHVVFTTRRQPRALPCRGRVPVHSTQSDRMARVFNKDPCSHISRPYQPHMRRRYLYTHCYAKHGSGGPHHGAIRPVALARTWWNRAHVCARVCACVRVCVSVCVCVCVRAGARCAKPAPRCHTQGNHRIACERCSRLWQLLRITGLRGASAARVGQTSTYRSKKQEPT